MNDERGARVALAGVPGLGPRRLTTLLAVFGTAQQVLAAPSHALTGVPGVSLAAATAIRALTPGHGLALLEATAALGGHALLPEDDQYPPLLRTIHDPPPVLFALGRLELLATEALAVVGSRDHTRYGSDACRLVVRAAVRAGLTVVSGMARGLDAVAHTAALEESGQTIGVLGNGLGVVYPAANRTLYQEVAERGLLLTEFPPGERPSVGSFPRRNRIVSGIARATLVVEAAAGSGALITAGLALEQGRDVLAVPGPITSPTSVGTNRLLRDGATPFLEPDDLAPVFPGRRIVGGMPAPAVPADPLSRALWEGPLPVDLLARRTGQPVAVLLGELSRLELEGRVVRRRDGLVALAGGPPG